MLLMERDRQYITTIVENALCTIAMMNVPINYSDPLYPMAGFRCFDSNWDVGQQTKPHWLISEAVVARRAAQSITVVALTRKNTVDSSNCKACRYTRNLKRTF